MLEQVRPALSRRLSATEFLRWYWLKVELSGFARSLGLSRVGSKEDISTRIAAFLDGRVLPDSDAPRRPSAVQLAGTLTRSTLIPPGQRSSQVLRRFFERETGPGFRFDAAIRTYLSESRGERTLGDAIAYYQSQRSQKTKSIGPIGSIGAQFELNRFTRTFYEQHPTASAKELRAAWAHYRSLPVDQRGRA